jgi:hypothetical protein
MYPQEMGRMELEPKGADDTLPNEAVPGPNVPMGGTTGWVGRNGRRCFFLQNEKNQSRLKIAGFHCLYLSTNTSLRGKVTEKKKDKTKKPSTGV